MADKEMTADDVIDVRSWLPADAYVEAAVVVVQYSIMSATTDRDRGPWLGTRRDSFHGAWNHLGMVESVANDVRGTLLQIEDESDG
jgi:hypothetical protein